MNVRYSSGFRMALLTLVRHGQASFLESNYDKLSERGERQARILGEYWLETGATFDQVYYGPACRHLRTGEIVAEVYRRAGAMWPETVTLAELDEYPGIEVMRTFLPGLMERHEDIRALEAEFRQAGDRSAAFRVYDKLFQRITRMWVDEELDAPEVESWRNFLRAGGSGHRSHSGTRAEEWTSGGVHVRRSDRGHGAEGLGSVATADAGVELDLAKRELHRISFFAGEVFAEQLQ